MGYAGVPSAFRKSPLSATLNGASAISPSLATGRRFGRGVDTRTHRVDAIADRGLQCPDVTRPTKEIEATRGVVNAGRCIRHEAAQRLVVLAAGRDDVFDCLQKSRMVELA